MQNTYPIIKLLKFLLLCSLALPLSARSGQAETIKTTRLSLDDCISIALQHNQSLQVSEAAAIMAEAQYQQAMSAYWPSISAQVNAQRADQDRTFSVRGEADLSPEVAFALNSIPAVKGAIDAGLAQPIKSIPMNFDVKLYDRDLLTASINLTYPLFTGGKRSALVGQADKGVKIAEVGRRKTNLEVIRDVKKYYYGAQFALDMEQLASDTLERFKALEDLTERLYQHGSMRVKKTDYLRTKTTTAMTRSILHEATYARELAYQALNNAMGLDWHTELTLAKIEQPVALGKDLEGLVAAAEEFNPDIQQLKLAVQVADDQITEARSGYYPVIGFQASAYRLWNEFDAGLINKDNRDGWTLGIGLQWNLFDGFRTSAKVNQAKARQRQLESQKILLDQGTALQIKQQFLRLRSASRQVEDTQEAYGYANENRKLHVRAYQEELVDTKDVIESQIVETFTQGAHYRSRHALEMALTTLEFLVGQNIQSLNQP
ncbi:MAG: TolC family protein [Gammaproteobacteria bacterium]